MKLEFLIKIFLTVCITQVYCFGIGAPKGLYGPQDKGIVVLESGNFSSTVLGSDTAFVVEFYSSYCGHCINFAPYYKEFAAQVSGWNSIIRVGAIDCAEDINIPTCREYEIMGYPSLKFFPVRAAKNELGEFRKSYSKEIHHITADVLAYLERVQANPNFFPYIQHWPKLASLRSGTSSELWADDRTHLAIVIFETSSSLLGKYLLMDTASNARLPVVVRRVEVESPAGQKMLKDLSMSTQKMFPLIVGLIRKRPEKVDTIWNSGESSRLELTKILNDYIWKQTKVLASTSDAPGVAAANKETEDADAQSEVLNEAEIKRRRYTTFMADLENSILYSLIHEVSQRSIISDKALEALQSFVDVLVKYFPGRPRTMDFLQELQTSVRNHGDVIKGEDLQDEVKRIREETKAFTDLGSEWIGCKGSKPIYSGYPCAAWMLWHTLTVAQLDDKFRDDEPREVLRAMFAYIDTFFGCRECARHFSQGAKGGEAIESDITSQKMSVLWLWKSHNRANKFLRGDLTDDKAFPKKTFPDKEHCTQCYDESKMGSDLWSEFRLDEVVKFLQELYDPQNISVQGLSIDVAGPVLGRAGKSHDLIMAEKTDKRNFLEQENKGWGLSFSATDVSILFGVYFLSAAILIVVCLKFVAKKKLSTLCSCCSRRPRSPSLQLTSRV